MGYVSISDYHYFFKQTLTGYILVKNSKDTMKVGEDERKIN